MAHQLKTLLVAHDISPSQAGEKLAAHLAKMGCTTTTHLLKAGKLPVPAEGILGAHVQQADVVWIGMSSSTTNAAIEIAVARLCVKHGKKFGFYSDTHGGFNRPHFSDFRDQAAFVMVTHKSEREKARSLFPNARIVATGNPLWAQYFQFAEADRTESRRLAGVTDPNTRIVLVSGTKSPEKNASLLFATVSAIRALDDCDYRVVFAPHPGHKPTAQEYDTLLQHAQAVYLNTEMKPGSVTSGELVLGAHIIMNGVSLQVQGIIQGAHCIELRLPENEPSRIAEFGTEDSFLVGYGAVAVTPSIEGLVRLIEEARTEQSSLRREQIDAMPRVDESESLSVMCETIEHCAG